MKVEPKICAKCKQFVPACEILEYQGICENCTMNILPGLKSTGDRHAKQLPRTKPIGSRFGNQNGAGN